MVFFGEVFIIRLELSFNLLVMTSADDSEGNNLLHQTSYITLTPCVKSIVGDLSVSLLLFLFSLCLFLLFSYLIRVSEE